MNVIIVSYIINRNFYSFPSHEVQKVLKESHVFFTIDEFIQK